MSGGQMEHDGDIGHFRRKSQIRFRARHRIRKFSQFLEDFKANPYPYLRNAPRYVCDMMEHFGTEKVDRVGISDKRWLVFNLDFGNRSESLIGQEGVQNAIYRQLKQFASRSRSDKLVLLHGPNGSSKSTTVAALMHGLTNYSTTDEGALYRFNWMFSDRLDNADQIGFEPGDSESPESYAFLKPEELTSKIPCELKDSPLFLIPRHERKDFILDAIASNPTASDKSEFNFEWAMDGDLCPKCKWIYEALLSAHHGDWYEVIRHIQVERFFFSPRYRLSAISIEPQGNIDASVRPLNHENYPLPKLLRNIPIFEASGDLIDANRGIVEYSDFLKRPLEANKYLLTTSEKGTIHLPSYTAHLDLVMCGTANEKQLNLFKRNPDFSSFKGRLSLIRVPYLLQYSREAELYDRHLEMSKNCRHVAPHTSTVTALWAVLTRLRRPSPKNFSPDLAPIVARLTPMQKAHLYNHGEVPLDSREVDQMILRNNIRTIREEHEESEGEFEGIYGAEYEGRRGASPREMMALLSEASENSMDRCLSPFAVFEQIEKLIKDISVYEFLRLPIDNGYNDCSRFIEEVREFYLKRAHEEVYSSIGLVDESEYARVLAQYFKHVKAFSLGERLHIASRDEYVDPSEDLMERMEKLLDIKDDIRAFRTNLMTRIGAFSFDNPDEKVDYPQLFPEIFSQLKASLYKEKNRMSHPVEENILRYFTDEKENLDPAEIVAVETALDRLSDRHGYCPSCARDVMAFVLRNR